MLKRPLDEQPDEEQSDEQPPSKLQAVQQPDVLSAVNNSIAQHQAAIHMQNDSVQVHGTVSSLLSGLAAALENSEVVPAEQRVAHARETLRTVTSQQEALGALHASSLQAVQASCAALQGLAAQLGAEVPPTALAAPPPVQLPPPPALVPPESLQPPPLLPPPPLMQPPLQMPTSAAMLLPPPQLAAAASQPGAPPPPQPLLTDAPGLLQLFQPPQMPPPPQLGAPPPLEVWQVQPPQPQWQLPAAPPDQWQMPPAMGHAPPPVQGPVVYGAAARTYDTSAAAEQPVEIAAYPI